MHSNENTQKYLFKKFYCSVNISLNDQLNISKLFISYLMLKNMSLTLFEIKN